ncbi:MAG: hypothetical protein Q9M13_02465 [Mariprofundales bacterium]|nr:hypothetical protein [Mariprofundales bacterium]
MPNTSMEAALNRVELVGVVTNIRQRWLPNGDEAVIAALQIQRPDAGADRANAVTLQPLPLRATGQMATQLAQLEDQRAEIQGYLRRRYYRRDGEPHWGQVEIWVERCQGDESESSREWSHRTDSPSMDYLLNDK